MERTNAWTSYDADEKEKVFAICEDYKSFISEGKTERLCVKISVRMAQAAGYRDLQEIIDNGEKLKAGDKVYMAYMGKSIMLAHIGNEPIEKGMNILGAHIDSPRLDIKQNPLYENTDIAYLDTHYYGGVKKYQWVTLPLAIHGVFAKKDGSVVEVHLGEKENDPVFCISDLLIHLAGEQLQKKAATVVEGENLDVIVGTMPLTDAEKDNVKAGVLALLAEEYGVDEEDFLSAELEVVPAGKARDCGLDRSLVMGYGQDDRICAYTSLIAMLESETYDRTSICLLVDKEEIGSVGATGMQSHFFEDFVAEMIALTTDYTDLKLRRAMRNSFMLSSDVSAALDPLYVSAFEKNNAAYLGRGIVFNKYTGARGKSGSNDANAEYVAKLRKVMDDNDVAFQTAELGKVDFGGGGTIAYILANYGMNVIDSGMAVLNMHAPWELSSKADIYEGYKAYCAFLKDAN